MTHTVTKLTSTKDGLRVNVYVEGKYSFTLSQNLLVKYGIYKGLELSEEQIENYKREHLFEKLYNSALNKLARRPHSRFELNTYLYRKLAKLDEKGNIELIDLVLNKLEENNYLNEEEYVKLVIDSKKERKSEMELRAYLFEKGVSAKLIDRIFQNYDFNNEEQIKKLVEKKIRLLSNKKMDKSELRNKIYQFLMRKGYKISEFEQVVSDAL